MNYKKIIAYFLFFAMFLSMTVNAATSPITINPWMINYSYTTNADGTITITGYTDHSGTDLDITIPPKIEGKKVTAIGDGAFSFNSVISNVYIPNSVTSIGNYSFSQCRNLRSISIPYKVTKIGAKAFEDCSSLKTAIFEGNAPSMGAGAFDNCASDFKISYYSNSTGFTAPIWNGYNSISIYTPTKVCIEQPEQGEDLLNKTTISGWALDEIGVAKIEILVNDNVAGTAIYGDARPDIYTQYPDYGNPNAGYHFDLDTSEIADGSCTITVRVTNKDGVVTATSVKGTVTHLITMPPNEGIVTPNPYIPTYVVYDPFEIDLNCQPTDTAMDLTKNVMYITDKNAKKLYAINCTTKEINSVSFDLPPESVYFKNGKVYVALLKQEHNSNMNKTDEKGAVAVVDAESMKIESQMDVNIDPYDIEVLDDNYIIISSGSSQLTNIKCYSLKTKQEVSSSSIRQQSYIEYNSFLNRLYTIDTDVSPRDYTAFNISSGKFTDPAYPGGYDSPYNGDYPLNTLFRISPDGKYLFNSSGTVFTCVYDKGSDIKYAGTLNKSFIDIAFDGTQKFYTVVDNGLINEYNYLNFQSTNRFIVALGDPIKLYYRSNQLIVLASFPMQGTKEYGIQIVNLKDGDVNGDGRTDTTDYNLIEGYLLGSKDIFSGNNSLKAADVNGDGKVNSIDCALVKRYIQGIINKFPTDSPLAQH